MTRHINLGDATLWGLQYTNSISATIIDHNTNGNPIYAPITTIKPPVVFDNPIMAISINTTIPSSKQWKYAGRLSCYSQSVLGDIYTIEGKVLLLDKFNLVINDRLANDYLIELALPRWFISANINVYQFEGTDTSDAEIIEGDIASLSTKLDKINTLE